MSKYDTYPLINEIRKGKQAGYKRSNGKYIWQACEVCGKERWVEIKKGQPVARRCLPCAKQTTGLWRRGSNNYNWKEGKIKMGDGYIGILLRPDDFFFPMSNHLGYVAEHRLTMAKALKRRLLSWEIIHHKNGIKNDNRLENLELITGKQHHIVDAVTKAYIKRLENRIRKLEEQNNVKV